MGVSSVETTVTLTILAVAIFSAEAQDLSAVVLQATNALGLEGDFAYGFEGSNRIRVEARGKAANVGEGGQVISGRFSWTAPDDGKKYLLQYTADENGYQPFGAHLPTPPPIPFAILRSIDYNERHPNEDQSKSSS